MIAAKNNNVCRMNIMFISTSMNKEKKVWHPQQEKILKTWGEAAACYRYMNNQAFLMYKKSSMRYTLPIIVISTVTGTANFAQSTFPLSIRPLVPLAIGSMNIVTAIMTSIIGPLVNTSESVGGDTLLPSCFNLGVTGDRHKLAIVSQRWVQRHLHGWSHRN